MYIVKNMTRFHLKCGQYSCFVIVTWHLWSLWQIYYFNFASLSQLSFFYTYLELTKSIQFLMILMPKKKIFARLFLFSSDIHWPFWFCKSFTQLFSLHCFTNCWFKSLVTPANSGLHMCLQCSASMYLFIG